MSSHKKSSQPLRSSKLIIFYSIFALFSFFLISIPYFYFTFQRTIPIYESVKSNQRGWTGHLRRQDPVLSHVPIPNSVGTEIMVFPPHIPVRIDENGFRIPTDGNPRAGAHPLLLTLGCSFTFGAAVPAENTFSFLIAEKLQGHVINAGECSYGLGQMYVQASRLVEKNHPDLVVVQYATWLTQRAQNRFLPTYIIPIPGVYFYKQGNSLALQTPVYKTGIFDLITDEFRDTPRSKGNLLSFFFKVGLPFYLAEDFETLKYQLKEKFKPSPQPETNVAAVEEFVFKEISNVVHRNGAKLVLLGLGMDANPLNIPDGVAKYADVVVNAQSSLLAHLEKRTEDEYRKNYGHWRNGQFVDMHPNIQAHDLIAKALFEQLKKAGLTTYQAGVAQSK